MTRKYFLRRYMPKNIYGRVLLLIIIPIVLLQVFIAYMFFNAHWSRVTGTLSQSVAGEIAVALELYEDDSSSENLDRLNLMLRENMNISIDFISLESLPDYTPISSLSALDQTLNKALGKYLEQEYWFDTTRFSEHIDIRVSVEGGILRFVTPRKRAFAPSAWVFLFWLVTSSLLLMFIAILFARNQAKPIIALARAAEAFGQGQDIGRYRPSGATEIRLAGNAFLKMRQRLQKQIEQRKDFLAGVSHDLRTPLTRLKLYFAMQDDDHSKAASSDLEEMETMLEGYLNYARDTGSETRHPHRIDLIIKDALKAYKDPIEFVYHASPMILLQPTSFKRIINNLVSNALKYGNQARVTLDLNKTNIIIDVDDDGPGIPKDERVLAFQPFQRLDGARNQNVEGVGLGLAITRDILQSYGGTLQLLDCEDMGGLKARILIPRKHEISSA